MYRFSKTQFVAAKVFLAAILVAFLLAPAYGAESVLSYASNIEVGTDRSVIVTETIKVKVEGDQIKRGIWRYIPTQSVDDNGYGVGHGLEFLEVLRNGEPDEWHIENLANGEQIYVGDADYYLTPGVYTYTLKYQTWKQVRSFDSHDEIYWNVTGNYWDFPIAETVARVQLPDGAKIVNQEVYTGELGSLASSANITAESETVSIIRATRPFRPGEGMSVVVAFEKGLMQPPSKFDNLLAYLSARRSLLLPLTSFLVVFAFFFSAWNAVGRDPQKGTIIPRFFAPDGFSPALAHYVHNFGWRKSGWIAFTAALMSLATKGLVILGESGKKTKVTVTEKEADDLPSGELKLYSWLQAKGTVVIDKDVGSSLHELHTDFISTIEDENRRTYFERNTGFIVIGVAISLLFLLSMLYFEVLHFGWFIIALVLGVFIAMTSGALSHIGKMPSASRGIAMFIFIAVFGNAATGLIASAQWFDFGTMFEGNFLTNAKNFVWGEPGAIAAISIILINVGFGLTMRAATVQGRKIMDQLEGFKMYMETAEKERLNLHGTPELTVKRFEQILPYAIALGVEKPWSEHFESELSRNARSAEDEGYSPSWHSGRRWRSGHVSSNIASTATGLSAAMIAAQPAQSSSSGSSSSGGFSGGGGGGGGGGGW